MKLGELLPCRSRTLLPLPSVAAQQSPVALCLTDSLRQAREKVAER